MNPIPAPPLSLYVHIPWCIKKCPYCDFNSHESAHIPEAEYVTMLKQDMTIEAELAQGYHSQKQSLQSIFFGGGTPSLFSAKAIGEIIDFAEQTFGFGEGCEITLEANPGTFEQEKFKGFYQAGVNRLSIGVQSFQTQHLEKLGRIHSNTEAIKAIEQTRRVGFENFNIDLMHGLPNQSEAHALADLQQAVALEPSHISWYQLTIEPNTVFYRQPPELPQDDTLAAIQDTGQAYLSAQGFTQYEISAYAQDQKRSKHNLNYWQFGDYLGIGAGAHGKLTDHKTQQIVRRQKTRKPGDYLQQAKCKQQSVKPQELALEFMMNTLRLRQPISEDLFCQRTFLPLEQIDTPLNILVQKGLLERSNNRFTTTSLGWRFLNQVLAEFMD